MAEAQAKPALVPVLRRRLGALARLAGVTGVAVLLAALALWQRASTGQPDFKPERMVPDLRENLQNVTLVQIETKAASFNVSRTAEGRWIVPDKANYPADSATVLKAILGLAEFDLIERRTVRSDWHEKLGLSLPKSGGAGTLVTMKNAKGEVLASVIVGNTVEGAAADGETARYVRRTNEPQTYVGRGKFDPPTEQARWLDKAFIEFARDRIKTGAVKPFKGRAYSVTRAKPQDENFRVVESLPAGRVLRTENEANAIGNALLGLSFDDVKPLSTVDFANAARADFVTFDGLSVSFSLIEQDREFWVSINAAADTAAGVPPAAPAGATTLKPDVGKEAQEINRIVGGWAYKVPRYKGVLLSTPLEDLLKPAGSP